MCDVGLACRRGGANRPDRCVLGCTTGNGTIDPDRRSPPLCRPVRSARRKGRRFVPKHPERPSHAVRPPPPGQAPEAFRREPGRRDRRHRAPPPEAHRLAPDGPDLADDAGRSRHRAAARHRPVRAGDRPGEGAGRARRRDRPEQHLALPGRLGDRPDRPDQPAERPAGQGLPAAQHAALAAEDRNFYHEGAVNVQGLVRAAVNTVKGEGTQGGSTITQQYVKNTYLSQKQSISRKVQELFIAIKVDATETKDDVLSGYLNTSYYGRGAYGIQAAAQQYFGVDASALTPPRAPTWPPC
ncbi:transglycosylase domain-containing protein [Kitasatospora aburaviensis]